MYLMPETARKLCIEVATYFFQKGFCHHDRDEFVRWYQRSLDAMPGLADSFLKGNTMTMPDKPTIENYESRARARGIPDHLISGLANYVVNGRPTGGFLRAVISNDLVEAMGRGTVDSIGAIRDIIIFFANCTPNGCYGSPAIYKAWVEIGGILGHMATQEKKHEEANRALTQRNPTDCPECGIGDGSHLPGCTLIDVSRVETGGKTDDR